MKRDSVFRMSKSNVAILAGLILALLLLPGAALAHPVGEDTIITPKGEIRAGVTPDSALHFFDKMFDSIGMALTFDDSAKAEKGLHIARERLVEAKEMLDKSNTNAARIAQQEHANALSAVEDSVRKLHNSNIEAELEREIEIEIELEEHQSEIETIKALVKAELSSRADSRGIASADDMLATIRSRADAAKSEVEIEKENSAQKLKLQTGKSDNEIELEVRRLEDNARRSSRGGMVEIELDNSGSSGRGSQLEESSRIRAFVSGDSSQARVEVEFTTTETDRNAILRELLSKLKMSSSDITSALDIENEREERKNELRTDIRVRDGIAEVKFRADFPVSATSREAIAKAIADELSSLTESGLRTTSRFEVREDDSQNDDQSRRSRNSREDELRGRENELGEDIRGNADENELRGRENELGEDVRGNADETELRGRANEPGEDARGQEAEARGRVAEGEAPRGADSPSDFDSTPDSRGGGSSGSSSGGGRGGSSSDD